MNWQTMLSVLGGFIGGTIFQFIIATIENYFKEKRRTNDLIKELEINKRKMDKWSLEFAKLKEQVMLENVNGYNGYIDYFNFITTTIILLQQDGLLYRKLDSSQIEKLQNMMNYFSVAVGGSINEDIIKQKEKSDAEKKSDKEMFILKTNYNLNKIIEYKSDIELIIKTLSK